MAPRGKKQRAGKAKDSPTSTEGEKEIAEGGDEKIIEDAETQEEVTKTEVDNGGEEAPPLKKSRGRAANVKKVSGKGKGASNSADEDKSDEGDEKFTEESGTEGIDSKVSDDHGDEEAAPAKKGRGRAKKAAKDDVATKEASNGEGDSKEDKDVAGAKKGRPRKKKVEDDEPEVMPKKKERGAKKNEAVAEDAAVDEGTSATDAEELKQKTSKREKRPPVKKAGKGKRDVEDDDKAIEEEVNGNKEENGQMVEQAEDEDTPVSEDGAGDAKPVKKAARGKAPAKATDSAAKKKPVGRGKKAAKGDELSEDNDVPVDGKKLRVLVEHCKS